jgi:hypothetical protein
MGVKQRKKGVKPSLVRFLSRDILLTMQLTEEKSRAEKTESAENKRKWRAEIEKAGLRIGACDL